MWLPVVLALALGSVWSAAEPALPRPLPAPAADDRPSGTEGRPYDLAVPTGYDEDQPSPLVVLLHGYTSDGAKQTAYFGLGPVAERENFLLVAPDGTKNPTGARFWNATDACCNFFGSDVDDVAYLDDVIDEISAEYTIDERRVYVVGHSNGGFMANRYACDRADRVAAIVSLAGMQWADADRCTPSSAPSVLHVHGTDDDTIEYEGGETPGAAYPGAEATVATWAGKNGCEGALGAAGPDLDIESAITGAETSVSRYSGCGKTDVELWTINGGSHVPAFDDRWPTAIWGFMAAHPQNP